MVFLGKQGIKRPILLAIVAIGIMIGIRKVVFAAQKTNEISKIFYTIQTTKLYKSEHGKNIIGVLTPATPVVLLSTPQDNKIKVSIQGWSLKGASTVIYYNLGQRIVLLTLNQNAVSKRVILKESKDTYGNTWKQVEITGWIKYNSLNNNLSTVMNKAKKIYEARCSACHALRPPTMFTANQWPSVLKTMAKNAALDPEQKILVVKYMQMHAKGFVVRKNTAK